MGRLSQGFEWRKHIFLLPPSMPTKEVNQDVPSKKSTPNIERSKMWNPLMKCDQKNQVKYYCEEYILYQVQF